MTQHAWKERIDQWSLDHFSDSSQPDRVTLPGRHTRLSCHVIRVDSVGCLIQQLAMSRTSPADWTVDRMERVAQTIAERVTYLLEPLSVVESDRLGATIQLRSRQPQGDADDRRYFELTVSREGSVHLMRYHWKRGCERQPIPYSLTYEILSRLAEDLDQLLA